MSLRAILGSRLVLLVSPHLLTQHDLIELTQTQNPRPKPDDETLEFGKEFSDHMLIVDWKKEEGWDTPKIVPFENFSFSPAISALHYAIEVCMVSPKYPHVGRESRLKTRYVASPRLKVNTIPSHTSAFIHVCAV